MVWTVWCLCVWCVGVVLMGVVRVGVVLVQYWNEGQQYKEDLRKAFEREVRKPTLYGCYTCHLPFVTAHLSLLPCHLDRIRPRLYSTSPCNSQP